MKAGCNESVEGSLPSPELLTGMLPHTIHGSGAVSTAVSSDGVRPHRKLNIFQAGRHSTADTFTSAEPTSYSPPPLPPIVAMKLLMVPVTETVRIQIQTLVMSRHCCRPAVVLLSSSTHQ